jgi:hypothetical protein
MNSDSPVAPKNIPENSQFLAGVGAGAWFFIIKEGKNYRIKRYTPQGEETCNRLFTSSQSFDITKDYTVTYPSHCAKCTLYQGSLSITLIAIEY